jgi:hypothetical protein
MGQETALWRNRTNDPRTIPGVRRRLPIFDLAVTAEVDFPPLRRGAGAVRQPPTSARPEAVF